MREILFRGKRKDNKEWVEGLLIKGIKSEWRIQNELYDKEKDKYPILLKYEVIPETVGQYIWKKDEDGNKLFTGMEISCQIKDTKLYYIEDNDLKWIGGENEIIQYTGIIDMDHNGASVGSYYFNNTGVSHIKIIGNTTDNPELLK